ncbi:antibiotic efflux pump outer membrane protein ArpC precursor [mine drainage metagenome]|uniref:Antibiotic efflux pump outer membrane protein ArpC n=1 Tax=mine drainage metagenome TaxID=410659 RepID=A0A1J5QY24_9ZZZZ
MRCTTVPPRAGWTVLAAALLAGCASVGPDFKAPPPPDVTSYTHAALPAATASAPGTLGAGQRFASGAQVDTQWWRSFGNAQLDALVARALHNSPTLEAARATLRQAQQLYAAQAGSTQYPTVSAKLGVTREGVNSAAQGQSNGYQNVFNLYNAGIGVNYNLDLFGGNRRALEALAAKADYQRYQLAGARLTLAANVVTTAFAQAQASAQLAANEAILRAQQHQLEITEQQFKLGATARSAVLSLRTQVETTRASLPALRNRREQADHLLATLLGDAPGAAALPQFELGAFTLPASLPVSVPSALLRQRPDVQASMALLHEATAQYGVAVSNLYPQINLSATIGEQALSTGALFGPGSLIWSLAGSLAQPLFNAGLKAGANAAQENLAAAGANYRATVLQALRNVADALRQLDNDAQALQAQQGADAAAQDSLQLVEQQYRLGAASYLQLLIAQQAAQQARISLIAAQAARLADSAALYQAMGGGQLG